MIEKYKFTEKYFLRLELAFLSTGGFLN